MNTHGKTLADVRRELKKAHVADGVAVSLALKQPWRPVLLWRAFKFILANHRREQQLQYLSDESMGFAWRNSLPKKIQRKLGALPPVRQATACRPAVMGLAESVATSPR